MFQVLTHVEPPINLGSMHDHILTSPTNYELLSCLLPFAAPPSHNVVPSTIIDSTIFASQIIEN